MTPIEVAALAEALATVVRDVVRRSLEPHAAKVALLEATMGAAVADVRTACLRELGDVRERVAVVETREPVPGPQGPPGPAGIDGKDGSAGLRFQGVFTQGKAYEPGDVATWDGSSWHCNEPTTGKPGDGSKGWTLMVKRGRDGRDAK